MSTEDKIIRFGVGPAISVYLVSVFKPSNYRASDQLAIWLLIFFIGVACIVIIRILILAIRDYL